MRPETCSLLVEKPVSDSGGGAGLDKMDWEEEQNTFMTELNQLEALTLQANHVGQDSRSCHVEQAEDVVDGSDDQRLFDDRVLLSHQGLPARRYEGSYSRAGTLVSVVQARSNETAVDEGAATNKVAVDEGAASLPSTAPKTSHAVASASEHAAPPVTWKQVVVGTTAAMPIISADTLWLNLMGFSRHEILGKSLQIVCGPKSARSTLTQLLAKAIPTPSPPSWLRLYRKNGEEIWLVVRATLRIDSGERHVALEMQTLDPRAEDEAVHSPPPAHREEFVRVLRSGSAADVEQQNFDPRQRRLLAVLADAERSSPRSASSPRSPWGESAGPHSPLPRRRLARSDELSSSPLSSSPRSPWGASARPGESSPLARVRHQG